MILCIMVMCFYKYFPIIINLLIFSKWENKNKASQTFFQLETEMYY